MKGLSVKLEGEYIPLDSLASVLEATYSLLADMEAEVTNGKRELRWDVSGLQSGSAQISIAPRDSSPPGESGYVSGKILEGLIAGLRDESAMDGPHFAFGRSVRVGIRRLKSLVNPDVRRIVYTGYDGESNETVSAAVTYQGAQDAPVESTDARAKTRISIGSVEGTLETLAGRDSYFNIWDRVTGKKVRCECTSDMLAELAENAWEKTVVVTGEIRENSDGEIRSVKVNRYRILTPPASVPRPSDLLGLYVRESNG